MMAGSNARDGAEAPPAPPALETVIVVSSLDAQGLAGGAGAIGGCKVVADKQQQQQQQGDCDGENVCRICHLSSERGEEVSELIQLGCRCKEELGTAHRDCAEAWFRIRGNRSCEICGANAKNIIGEDDDHFMEEWHEGRVQSSSDGNVNSSERGGCWRSQSFCNFLMACLVIAFIFPWFFRVNMF